MQDKKTNSTEKINKRYNQVISGFKKRNIVFSNFCKENRIDRSLAFRALKDQRKGEKAKLLKQLLIDVSKGKISSIPIEYHNKK